MIDAALIDRARAGDRVALEQLLQQVAPLVHRFGMRMCRHRADADDVLQDTLLSVATHLTEFEGRSSLASWVFTLARTACARKRRGIKNQARGSDQDMDRLASADETPEQSAGDKQLRRALEGALGGLSDEHREVVLLRDMEGLSAAEVAASLGISVEAVKSRLHRARAALREALRGVLERDAPASQPGCPDVLAAFSAKLEDDLGADDCAAMEQHIASCAACASACSAVRTALWACRATAQGTVPAEVQARVKAAIRSLAKPRTS
jgi:RNA polymerase sigma-70 factor, ECF subfamily